MKKKQFKRQLFAIHSWIGLLLGIFFLLIAVSGAISVFRFDLNTMIYGSEKHDGSTSRISYDSIFSMAQKKFPGVEYYVVGFEESYRDHPGFYSGVDHITPALLKSSMQYRVNYIDPYSGKNYLETNSSGKNNWIDWIMGFHYSFALGEGGELCIVLFDIALLVSILTGIIFYRRHLVKVLLFKEKIRFSNWRLASSGVHRYIGTWALLFNLLIFLSGLYIQKKFFTTNWWSKYGSSEIHNHKQKLTYPLSTVSLDSLKKIAAQKAAFGKFNIMSVDCGNDATITALGNVKDNMFMAYGNFVTVTFDRNGTYLHTDYKPWKDESFAEKFEDINFSAFHTGWAFGLTGKIIWCLMGFSPALLSITGFLLWWRRFS